ncbi:MAG: NAD(P)H-binding protein [bacterium]|nr:NAD(P)H-binding protein [bacterium]
MQAAKPDSRRVLVVGASGYFGRLLVEDLLQTTHVSLVLAGREQSRLESLRVILAGQGMGDRLETVVCELGDAASVRAALSGVAVAVCAAGPYQALPLTLLDLCIELGIPYLDLCDDRGFLRRVRSRVAGAQAVTELPPIGSGFSAVPALSAVLARLASPDFDVLEEIHVQIAPGNRQPRAEATVLSLLDSVGKRFDVLRDGSWQPVWGGSQSRSFAFPEPVGRRRGVLVDVADHDVLPEIFAAAGCEFRVSAELAIFNPLLRGLSWLRRLGFLRDPSLLSPSLRAIMAVFGRLGSDAGALGVEVQGRRAGASARAKACIVASQRGERIPVMPATLLVERLIEGSRPAGGLLPFADWIDAGSLAAACRQRGFELTVTG